MPLETHGFKTLATINGIVEACWPHPAEVFSHLETQADVKRAREVVDNDSGLEAFADASPFTSSGRIRFPKLVCARHPSL